MEHGRNVLRVGAYAIIFALLLRLGGSGAFQPVADFLAKPKISSLLLYLETGRVVRFSTSYPVSTVFSMESHTPDLAQPLHILPSFTPEDAKAVDIKYNCTLKPDVEALMTRPLSWDLTSNEPTVLILHTHATESYTKSPGEGYTESAAFRTLSEDYNMISVGDRLAQLLEDGGISVIHDRALHDHPSYSGSYNHARKSTATYLEEYPSIRLVLDLHRDAAGDEQNQMRTQATVDGQSSAQLMVVIGTNHANYEENLSLGLKLHAQLEQQAPGIMRPLQLRAQRFNQDLSPGALLIEVGAAGNTHPEAHTAARELAKAIVALARGTE